MTEYEQQQKAYEAYHERWLAQYGFVPPLDPEHPITKRFWELEAAWHASRAAFAWRRLQKATAERKAAFAEPE